MAEAVAPQQSATLPPVLTIAPAALEVVRVARDQEPDSDTLALWVEEVSEPTPGPTPTTSTSRHGATASGR